MSVDESCSDEASQPAAGTPPVKEEDSLKASLIAFSQALNSSSTKAQVFSFQTVAKEIKRNQDIAEGVYRGICRVVVTALQSKNLQRPALKALFSLFVALDQQNHDILLKHFTEAISAGVKLHPSPNESVAKPLVSLACIYSVALHGQVANAELISSIVSALSSIGYYLLVGTPPQVFAKKLALFVKELGQDEPIARVGALGEGSAELGLSGSALFALNSPTSVCPDVFLSNFTKHVLLAKQLPPIHLIAAASSYLRHMSKKQFSEAIMPALKKSLLRSPEAAIYGVTVVFSSLSFPADEFVADVLKPVLGVCTSSLDEARAEALRSLIHLSRRCSPSALSTLLKSVVDHVSGVKVVEQKVALLETIGLIGKECANDEGAADDALASAVSILAKGSAEANESVVRAQWEAVSVLASRVYDVTKIHFLFKEWSKQSGLGRGCALRALATVAVAKKIETLPADARTPIAAELDKTKEPLEAVAISIILLLTSAPSSDEFKKVAKSIAASDALLKEKTLGAMRGDDGRLMVAVAVRVLSQAHESPLLVRCLAVAATWKEHSVRDVALRAIKLLLSSPIGPSAASFIRELYDGLEGGWLDQAVGRRWIEEASVPGHLLIPVLSALLQHDSHYQSLAAPALLLCSVPRIAEEDGSIWLRWFHQLEKAAEAKEWIGSEEVIAQLVALVLGAANEAVRGDALAMLSSAGSPRLTAALWAHLQQTLDDLPVDEYEAITDREVSVWRCPEGTLFNTEVLDFDETADAKNMKRESKTYKFKEQVAEMELRRELAEKRRKEGKLTPKQKELMEKELAKEKIIRERVGEQFKVVESVFSRLRAMVEADGAGALARPSLITATIPFIKSPLAAHEAATTFISIVHAAFNDPEDPLHELLGHCSLRVLGSKWTEQRWTEENCEGQLKRLLGLLVERVFVVETGDDTEEESALLYEDTLGSPQLCALYPLVNFVVAGDKFSDGVKQQVLDLVKNAMNRRLAMDNSVLHLPLVEMATLLFSFAVSSTLSSHTSEALLALTKLISLVNDTGAVTPSVTECVLVCLDYLRHDRADMREAALSVLSASQLLSRVAVLSEDDDVSITIRGRLLCARFDSVEGVAAAASQLWFASLFNIKEDLFQFIFREIWSDSELVRSSAARALTLYLQELPSEMQRTVAQLDDDYHKLRELEGVEIDQVGRLRKEAVDRWEARLGVVSATLLVAQFVPVDNTMTLINMLVPDGLDDRNERVRDKSSAIGVVLVSRHGAALREELLPLLEGRISALPDGQAYDNLRQGLVVLLGTLARYVDDDSKVRAIVGRLVEALSTPSQKVQEAVSACLSPLVRSIDNALILLATMQKVLFEGASYGQRRGAAYGIAGMVAGLGIPSVRENDLIQNVEKALMEKAPLRKQGALLALEMLSSAIGKLFEPYLVKCLAGLLLCFGDSDESVRRAAQEAARAGMGSLSAHGVKCILPKVLDALDNDSWRTKCAAVDLLGAMAFCAPRQLSSCLPTIVPKLIEVLADSHIKVRATGESALNKIGSVIQNPEILGVSTQIMQGLIDPATKTSFALNTIVNTKFIHYIDAASLALIMPIVRRAFEDRNSETRRLAAQIISNIYKLSEDKDMEPYLRNLVPGLQKALMDPVPEIRTVAAKALGAVISRSRGETSIRLRTAIIPWLKDKLISEQSTVDRSGAAQGLAEVLGGVGTEQLDYVMPEIIQATESAEVSAETRDGYILMYIYLPMVFGERFQPYLPRVIPSILRALADENEYVRASALKAGQRLISQFVSQARRLLLPQLQAALADSNWRIRNAGVTLIGDFLFNISGITGKSTSATNDEDDTMGMEQAGKTIVRALGQRCRDDVLAGLYLSRSDVALGVRQGASHVWKMVVANTPRTLKELMKTLFEKVLESLASSCEERQQTAARCLGELVRKMGEKIILEVLPVLQEYQDSEDVEKKIGVAVALHEIIANMSKEVLQHHLADIVVPLRRALSDPEERVRNSAADSFSVFHNSVGTDAYDEVIGPLLDTVSDEEDSTLLGLAAVMGKNSRAMLPYVLPRLTRKPVKVKALCTLAAASGDSLGRQLSRILDSLLAAAERNDQYEPMVEPCEEVALSVCDEEGVAVLIDYVLNKANEGNVPAAVILHTFVEKTTADLDEFRDQIISGCMQLYASKNEQIVDHAVLALLAYCKKMDPAQQMDTIPIVRKLIGNLALNARGKTLLGFSHPKGLNALVAIFREGVLQGGVDTKALSSEALGQLVFISTAEAIKPHVVSMTGPLIRVLGDRFPPNVKGAILACVSHLLDKVDTMLRPFLPQLQSTFLKCLQDGGSRPVRLASAGALSRLVRLSPKPEPVLAEMIKTVTATSDRQLLETTLVAARAVVANSSATAITPPTLEEGYKAASSCAGGETSSDIEDSITACAGALAGEVALRLPHEYLKKLLNATSQSPSIRERTWAACAIQQMAKGKEEYVAAMAEAMKGTLVSGMQGEAPVASGLVRASAHLLLREGSSLDSSLLTALARAINHQSVEVRRVVGISMGTVLSRLDKPLDSALLKIVVPQLVNGTKESNSAVRSAAELALVYALRLQEGQTTYEEYLGGCEGAAKNVLMEVHRTLTRVVKGGDLAVESIDNILSAP